MKYNPLIHNRRSIRLKGYDYSKAALYFITICVQDMDLLFDDIENGKMILNDAGKMVQLEWGKLLQRFPNIRLHEFAVKPNHFHGILEIVEMTIVDRADKADSATTSVAPRFAPKDVSTIDSMDSSDLDWADAPTDAPKNKTVGDMIGAFKSITTVEYINGVKNSEWEPFNGKLWQRDYYDHIIRDERAYLNISAYIIDNPARWEQDKFNSKRKPSQ